MSPFLSRELDASCLFVYKYTDKKSTVYLRFLREARFLRVLRSSFFTMPNEPFLAKKPAFSRRFSRLAVACFLRETMRPHLFIISFFFVSPPEVWWALPCHTAARDPTASVIFNAIYNKRIKKYLLNCSNAQPID